MKMEQVVAAALRAVPMRANRPLRLPRAYSYATASVVVVVVVALITNNISISITNTTKAGAKLKRNKSTSAGTSTSTSIHALRQMVAAVVVVMAAALVVVGMTLGVRVGNRRLPCLTTRRAFKMATSKGTYAGDICGVMFCLVACGQSKPYCCRNLCG